MREDIKLFIGLPKQPLLELSPPVKGDIKKNTYKSDIQLTSMEIFGKSKLNELAIFYYL